MPRQARVVVPGAPHHVTQRGNRRQRTFFSTDDYRAYLRIAAKAFGEAGVEIWAYCLMPNHVHLIAIPPETEALARAVGATHMQYTRRVNAREKCTGYLWQGRFSSFPMDESHLINCARYVGLNPVRSGLTQRAIDWPWSSVRAHVSGRADTLLTAEPLLLRLGEALDRFFEYDAEDRVLRRFREASATGRPLGPAEWVQAVDRRPA